MKVVFVHMNKYNFIVTLPSCISSIQQKKKDYYSILLLFLAKKTFLAPRQVSLVVFIPTYPFFTFFLEKNMYLFGLSDFFTALLLHNIPVKLMRLLRFNSHTYTDNSIHTQHGNSKVGGGELPFSPFFLRFFYIPARLAKLKTSLSLVCVDRLTQSHQNYPHHIIIIIMIFLPGPTASAKNNQRLILYLMLSRGNKFKK